jgi:hypothetical protein
MQEIQTTGLSVQATSLSNSDMLKVHTVVQQIITELNDDKITVITQMVPNLMKQNGS